MPDQPDSKRRRGLPPAAPVRAAIPYAELRCKTNFSFLEGASHPDELVFRAAALGYRALAITDRNSLAGVVRAHGAAKQAGLKILIGAELDLLDAPTTVVWAADRAAYGRLTRLLTRGRRNAPKGECCLTFADLAAHAEGLLAGVAGLATAAAAAPFREVFSDRAYLLAQLHCGPHDELELAERQGVARHSRLPLVAVNDVHFHDPRRRPLADVLMALRAGCTVAAAGERLFANGARHLKSPAAMQQLFHQAPEALARTVEIAERCHFSLDELRYEYPEELAPPGETPLAYLTRLTWEGAAQRFPAGIPPKVRRLLEHELQLIGELRYESYFLTVWDLVRFAREREILCQGRGSAANSAVCFCLGITSVDPDRLEVLFERFISRERNEAPDIDVDFEHERREEVIQYVYQKYGRERAGMTAEVISYRPRSAVRDVGKALGLSLDRVDVLAKMLDRHATLPPERCAEAGLDPHSTVGRQLQDLVGELLGFPRHLGQHVGGLVITQGPLCELVPIENAAMEGRTVIEWDKDDLDELGILKVDCLALGMLTALRKCFALVEQATGRRLTLANLPPADEKVYDMICAADTMGVFQIESRAQMSMLPRLKPRCFYDLVIEVAIVRPGPIQGNMVHPYLRRRAGEAVPAYPSSEIGEVLRRTLGVPLFQEQAMQLAVVAAGFTPGEADQLRRAMAAWRRPGMIDQFRVKLLQGMRERGLSPEFAELVFHQIRGFGEYGFPESHAASFALLVYASAWLKCHYPAAFCVALLNSQPLGFYAPAQLIRNAQEHGLEVRPVDVNHSCWDCTLEGEAIRLGFRQVLGLSEQSVACVEAARRAAPFASWEDFIRRTRLSPPLVARLARADSFQSLQVNRQASLWQALGQEQSRAPQPLFAELNEPEPPPELPLLSPQQEVFRDYQTAGLSLKAHPLAFYRAQLDRQNIVRARALAELKSGSFVRVAGLVLVRQRPGTAKGITFVTLEDETGTANLIIRPDVWEKFYQIARTAPAYIAHGRLQSVEQVIHVLVSKLENLSVSLGNLRAPSRDFH
ncbi:MAG TPA: error-prone DNA polymerase [Pirellulales bacterium]|jgi:error-prone DNA polymerase|nr:error-prone DNA polymerase [Pirellulales bacterium]